MFHTRPLHVVFVLPGAERIPYHFSTLQQLAEAGCRVTMVSCRTVSSEGTDAQTEELLDAFNEFDWRRNNFVSIFENNKDFHIRDPGKFMKYSKVPRSNHELFLLRSYTAYLQRLPESNFYLKRWKSYLGDNLLRWVDKPLVKRLLGTRLAFQFLTWLERRGRPDKRVVEWLRTVKADVVVASPSNSRNSLESDYLFAARHLRIPTVVPVLSWDNLTTKGLIPFGPSLVLAWNREQAREAQDIHRIAKPRIIETGSPFFDKWFDRSDLIEKRERFLARIGLDPARPLLVYLGSSWNVAQNESWLVKQLLDEMRKDEELRNVQLVVRPHPANDEMLNDLKDEADVIWQPGEIPFTDRSTGLLMNTLVHAFAIVGINTSGIIDALALDRPCFSIKTDRYQDTHLLALHFRHMLDAGAIQVADDLPQLLRDLGGALSGRDERAAQRRSFVRDFIRPHGLDRPAGQVAAEAILMLGERKPYVEIARAIDASGSGLEDLGDHGLKRALP